MKPIGDFEHVRMKVFRNHARCGDHPHNRASTVMMNSRIGWPPGMGSGRVGFIGDD